MLIYFAGDHAGFKLKRELMDVVRSLGHEVKDLGPFEVKPGDDYPDYVIPLARAVASHETRRYVDEAGRINTNAQEVRGIVVAGSGQGEIIAMNRVRGARAALFCPCNLELIKASRDHNDSNILAIGARFCALEEAKKAILMWLKTPFSKEERHVRRLKKIEQMTNNL